jgi:hypothetical protein
MVNGTRSVSNLTETSMKVPFAIPLLFTIYDSPFTIYRF